MSTIPWAGSLIGQPLFARGGEEVGQIRDVYADRDTDHPLWALVGYDDEAHAVSLLPLVDPEQFSTGVRVALDLPRIARLPELEVDVLLSPLVQLELLDHFAIADPGPFLQADAASIESRTSYAVAPATPPPPSPPFMTGPPPQDAVSDAVVVPSADADADPPTDGKPFADPRRFLQARCPDRVELRKTISFTARIGLVADDHSVPLEQFDIPPEGADLTMVLSCPGFRPEAEDTSLTRTFHLPPDRASQWELFKLTAVAEGTRELSLIVFRGGTSVGELGVEVTIEADSTTGPARDHHQELDSVDSVPGEVTLYITYDTDAKNYRFLFFDEERPGNDTDSGSLVREPREVVGQLIAELNQRARDKDGMTAKGTEAWLREQGAALWQELVPAGLREEFWLRQERIGTLTIVTARDTVPWELLYPLDKGSDRDRGFLAEQFPIVRAIPKCLRPKTLSLTDPLFVKPDEAPQRAEQEIADVAKLLGTSADTAIRNLARLTELIAKGDFGLLHFACHNTVKADQASAASIAMAGGHFIPTLLTTASITEPLKRTKPLIFMNACSTAQLGGRYTEMTGWASKFIQAGASAFVGSQWEVRDAAAPVFAEAFYGAVVTERKTLGEALQIARAAVRETEGDPSWLAYSLYGNARAKVA